MTTDPVPAAGHEEEPSWVEVLERALRVVEADVRATGLDGSVSLLFDDWADSVQCVHAVYDGSGSGSTVGLNSEYVRSPVLALVAIADDLQNSIMHVYWGTVWPVCPAHNLGAHAREHRGEAVWWCNHADGHVIAAIGEWHGRRKRGR